MRARLFSRDAAAKSPCKRGSRSEIYTGACPARNDVDFYEFCDESNLTIIHEMIVREH